MSSSSSSETSDICCELTVFVKNTFQTITHCNSAKYSYPCLALTNTICYPEEKVILDVVRASMKRTQLADVQLGNSLFFTNFKFFSVVAVLYILNNPISMECRALQAHIKHRIYNWTCGDFYSSLSEDEAIKCTASGDARLF